MSNASDPIVWVVEDDPSVQRMIAENLKGHHYTPVVFGNAEKAYTALQYQKLPALIILDVLLPGMSGVDLIRLLKQNKVWEKIPVVVVSVLTRDGSLTEASNSAMGSTYWVNKPFEAEDLIRTIQGILTAVR